MKGFGECIDCGHCVLACPMGIDIRNGLQYQCISCALCIDACEHDLVNYTSENALNGRKTQFLRPKTVGYGVILAAATTLLIWSVLTRAPYTGTVEQIRQPLYTQLSDGGIRNAYEVKLNNKLTAPMTVGIYIEGLPGATLDMDGMERIELAPQERTAAGAGAGSTGRGWQDSQRQGDVRHRIPGGRDDQADSPGSAVLRAGR